MQRTELALFAQEFQRALAPLGEALLRLQGSAGAAGLPPGLERGLGELGRELSDLSARIAAERASVFVFGPAKAGKSTLVAALAGTRANEIASLPGHPCVQRVRHAAEPRGELLAFDGTVETLSDPAGLALRLQRAHADLAAAARAARAAGEAFDPARHLRGAVRRVERALPAELLRRTAVELVECPPIHGPLFPTYAAMLMGEPDAARAAVFVVRAAQLFDDAVFDGIEELLAAFERPVLVLNLDGASREPSGSGALLPALEREDPARLVEAFEQLTTCEPLAHALRSGAVRVLAIDCLSALEARLRGEEEGASPGRGSRFADLLAELAGVLDGHEAFRALVASAQRRGGELAQETRELLAAAGAGELARRRTAAADELAARERKDRALEHLGARERPAWAGEEPFLELRARLETRIAARAREQALQLSLPLGGALEDWFASGASLATLLREGLAPRVAAAERELDLASERMLREELRARFLPSAFSAATADDLVASGLELAALLAPPPEEAPLPSGSLRPLDVDAIPVRPGLGQRLTLRREAEVRRALLGPPEAPAREITSAEKARRLGRDARAAMKRSAEERALAALLERARAAVARLHELLLASFARALAGHVERERASLRPLLAAAAERLAHFDEGSTALAALERAAAGASSALGELAERFRDAHTLVPAPRTGPRELEREEEELEGVPAED